MHVHKPVPGVNFGQSGPHELRTNCPNVSKLNSCMILVSIFVSQTAKNYTYASRASSTKTLFKLGNVASMPSREYLVIGTFPFSAKR